MNKKSYKKLDFDLYVLGVHSVPKEIIGTGQFGRSCAEECQRTSSWSCSSATGSETPGMRSPIIKLYITIFNDKIPVQLFDKKMLNAFVLNFSVGVFREKNIAISFRNLPEFNANVEFSTSKFALNLHRV